MTLPLLNPPCELIQALRRVEAAQSDCEKASVLCANDDYELCHFGLRDEIEALFRCADAHGINMRSVAKAMGGQS